MNGAAMTSMKGTGTVTEHRQIQPRWMERIMAAGLMLLLPGCLSMGGKLPDTLLDLTPSLTAEAGSAAMGAMPQALAVIEPHAAQKLDVKRVPVQVSASQVAYLQDAVWVEKPVRLFQRLLAETLRADGRYLVIDGIDRQYSAGTRLTGQLLDMGYDAPSQSAVVRFEAVLEKPAGAVATRRFESIVPGVSARAGTVGSALNQAANDVAAQVAAWVATDPGK